jgi:hypothetical protein
MVGEEEREEGKGTSRVMESDARRWMSPLRWGTHGSYDPWNVMARVESVSSPRPDCAMFWAMYRYKRLFRWVETTGLRLMVRDETGRETVAATT